MPGKLGYCDIELLVREVTKNTGKKEVNRRKSSCYITDDYHDKCNVTRVRHDDTILGNVPYILALLVLPYLSCPSFDGIQ